MAANRTVASLSIALIVFVMLTFVLAVTTYVFFKQKIDAEGKQAAATADLTKAQASVGEHQAGIGKLLETLGIEVDATVRDQGPVRIAEFVQTEVSGRFDRDFPGFNEEPRSLDKLVRALEGALGKKDEQMLAQRQTHDAENKQKDEAIAKEQETTKQAQADVEKARQAAKQVEEQFKKAREGHEKQQQILASEKQTALDGSSAFEKLRQAVAAGEQYLSPDQQRDFRAKDSPEAKLGVLFAALRAREKAIVEQNEVLAQLRGASPAVQEAVRAANRQDDRIDGFDGRIAAVDEASRTAIVSFPSTAGLRPGLTLAVFDPDDPRPAQGARKGMVEIVSVEGPTAARARITRGSVTNPILGGDGVASSLWSPGATREAVIVGFVQLDQDAAPDPDALAALVERAGGRVAETVTPATAMLVDAGSPKPIGGAEVKVPGWRPNVDEKRRERELKLARQYGIPVVGIAALLESLGIDREDLQSGRPTGAASVLRTAPAGAGNVAY